MRTRVSAARRGNRVGSAAAWALVLACAPLASRAAPPPGMVPIPAGSFDMGDTFNEGESDERPVHVVTLDAYYIDRYEVTIRQYADALNWAHGQGLVSVTASGIVYKPGEPSTVPYCDTASSSAFGRITWDGATFGVVAGEEDRPMTVVTWYGAAAYANWRSAMHGRPPSYNVTTWTCNFGASGYRLPTEAEWERAARGGTAGHRFAWPDTDTIQHSRANYFSATIYSYDTSPTRGYHPTYAVGSQPYTAPVGSFAPNDYGVYDTVGNVWEWCHDWYSGSYYSSGAGHHPRGPSTGTTHSVRGGSWGSGAYNLRCATRNDNAPTYRNNSIGFRLVASRGAPDADGDGDVDVTDFQAFLNCFNGPQRPPAQDDCEASDFDSDGDVDLTDFTVFLACFSGPDRPPACS